MHRPFAVLVLLCLLGGARVGAEEFAWLRETGATLWQSRVNAAPQAPLQATPLSAATQTPLGSVWKLFVYAYLVDQHIPSSDYVCGGKIKDEVYCCEPGQSIDREHALVQSCGLYFEPKRLGLAPAAWRRYWQAQGAPGWLGALAQLQPTRTVSVLSLLEALNTVPNEARLQTSHTLLSVLTLGKGAGSIADYGGQLRVKSWTMPDPVDTQRRVGGGAGWLADGTPVWLRGSGGSAQVLPALAPKIAAILADNVQVPDDSACVAVQYFARYPVREVLTIPNRKPAEQGALQGDFEVQFVKGQRVRINSQGEMQLQRGAGALRLSARLGINEYVARVVDREGAANPPEAAKALAIAARSYLVQQAGQQKGCFTMIDSSATQRVSPRRASRAAKQIADWTDGLIVTGVPVQYHLSQAAPNQLAWQAAVAAAMRHERFDVILARAYPGSGLSSFLSPLGGDCAPLPAATRWLANNRGAWSAVLGQEVGYEAVPDPLSVCQLRGGNPYADAARARVYIRRLISEDDRIALVHEYLHLAFAHHPRGLDEAFIEQMARTLMRGRGQ